MSKPVRGHRCFYEVHCVFFRDASVILEIITIVKSSMKYQPARRAFGIFVFVVSTSFRCMELNAKLNLSKVLVVN